jgi:hypothetical protein
MALPQRTKVRLSAVEMIKSPARESGANESSVPWANRGNLVCGLGHELATDQGSYPNQPGSQQSQGTRLRGQSGIAGMDMAIVLTAEFALENGYVLDRGASYHAAVKELPLEVADELEIEFPKPYLGHQIPSDGSDEEAGEDRPLGHTREA